MSVDILAQIRDRAAIGIEPEQYDIGWESEAIDTVSGQNSNNSVRVTDEFYRRLDQDENWDLIERTTGKISKTVRTRELWYHMCTSVWASGDTGVQNDDTIQSWHTCPNDGKINGSNPCFTGDTLVWTLYGPRRFDELARDGSDVAVLTELEDGKLAYRKMISPRLTRRNASLVEITFKAQTGPGRRTVFTTVKVTPDHEFYLKRGGVCRAIDLMPKDRIESAYRRKANQKGYIGIYATNGDSVMEHHLIAEMEYGRRPVYPYEHGHHLDESKANNFPGNIEIISASEHNSQHMKGDRNPMRRWFGSLNAADKRAHLAKMSAAAAGERNPNYGNIGHLAGRRWITNGSQNKRVPPDYSLPQGWRYGKTQNNANHIVVKVERLQENADVYCGTVPSTGRFFISLGDRHKEGVLVSNCGEYLFLDNTACNLASQNLCKFVDVAEPDEPRFNCDAFEHATRLWTTVLDISVSMASFPSQEIAKGSYKYRTLGLGYANLGGLLAQFGLRYDSDAGRALAAAVTALMTGIAYRTSAEIATELGPFPRWAANATPMQAVLAKHFDEVGKLRVDNLAGDIVVHAYEAWKIPFDSSFRNAQVTLLAPTGTIALVMDCATTGIEPFYSRSSIKQLAGGGSMAIDRDVLDEDCAVPSRPGGQCLSPEAHVKMVAAVQPFLSGGVSKTINLPHDATVEDVDHVYRLAHRLGLKSVALYRDGSKLTQPLASVNPYVVDPTIPPDTIKMKNSVDDLRRGDRRELPSRRPRANRWKLEVGGQSVYISTGDHEDGELGEIFVGLSREGSDVRSMMECFSKVFSIALQHGVPLGTLVDAFIHTKFEPAGMVAGDTRVRFCSSLPDLIVRHLAVEYLGRDDLASVPRAEDAEAVADLVKRIAPELRRATHSAPGMVMLAYACRECGGHGTLRRTGTCVTCSKCGYNEGCG